ncbi:hypothetical protein [Okeania sp. KiyG1]|nr:hypothetical protein [Okeania sp. KiyG1]
MSFMERGDRYFPRIHLKSKNYNVGVFVICGMRRSLLNQSLSKI